MKKWSIGVLGASDIAYKRFLPALEKSNSFSFAGIASRNPLRCNPFVERFGGKIYQDYHTLIHSPDVDCVYVPLPPALHAKWGEKILLAGKHLMMEKPFTTSLDDTNMLLMLAEKRGLAVHENYMFRFHYQIKVINELIASGALGEIRMVRSAFTFPFRGDNDFRYLHDLGGGALLDCGGYPISLTLHLLGPTAHVEWAWLNESSKYGVDTGGSAVFKNEYGLPAIIYFGMDDTYRCELEICGNKSSIYAHRIFTAPPDLPITLQLIDKKKCIDIQVGMDDQFLNSLEFFGKMIDSQKLRDICRRNISAQSSLVQQVRDYSKEER